MKIKITVVLILSLLILSGCTNSKSLKANHNDIKENTVTNNTAANSPQEKLAIYKIDSDTFDMLLENNSFEAIESLYIKRHSYPKDGNRYTTYTVTIFEITDDILALIHDKTIWEEYFATDNPNEKIENIIVFEAPYTPITAWFKTNIDTYFLTINKDSANGQVCNLYSQSDYIEQYKSHLFALKINGLSASNSKSVKVYHNNADLPLLEILTSCGASIKWKNEKQVNITLNNETYLIDINNNHFYNIHNKENNLLANCNGGGPFHMYFSDDEYYTDSETLQCVMNELNQKIEIEYNTKNKIVNIITK